MKVPQLVGLAITVLSVVMMALSVINLTVDFVFGWPTWLSFSVYLRVAGIVCLLATITGVMCDGGRGRWWFALLFGVAAYHLLVDPVPGDFPTRPEARFGFAIYTVLFAFGGLHLESKGKHWLGKQH